MRYVIIVVSLLSLSSAEENVKYAAIIYRHGDRTPVDPYPTDPWRNESLWPVKFGELTNIGKRQHFALGKWFRQRYSHLLSSEFDPSEIYVRSTDVDRTLMSAQANLAGMYPPIGKSVWDTQLMWQPIPVHTVPEKNDEVLAMKKHCSAYIKNMETLIHSKAFIEKLNKYQGLMNYLTASTGRVIKNYNDIEFIYNTLYIESLYNFTLPNWTLAVYPDKMREPSCYSFTTSTATPLLARLKVGPLLKQIMSNMVNSTNAKKTTNHLKLSMYSAHDETVSNILNALGIFDGNCPAYTATVLIELLHDNTTGSHSIRISYRNTIEIVEPIVLKIPYCGEICPIERFIKLYENLLTVDWDHECGNKFSYLFVVLLFIGLGLFASIYFVHKLHFGRVSKQYIFQSKYSSINPVTVIPVKL